MEKLILEASAKTPEVVFDPAAGTLLLKGRSIPENSIEFYKPLNDWIDGYAANPGSQTVIEMKLENLSGTDVSVNWYFEEDDEDMEEAGEDYQAIIKLPFKMIEVEEI